MYLVKFYYQKKIECKCDNSIRGVLHISQRVIIVSEMCCILASISECYIYEG